MGTLLHRQPQHPILPAWSERALVLLDQADDHDLSVLLGGYLVIYFLWWGDAAKAWEVIERLATRAHAPHVSPKVWSYPGLVDSCECANAGIGTAPP